MFIVGGGVTDLCCWWWYSWVVGTGGIPSDDIDVADELVGTSTIGEERDKSIDVKFIYFKIIVRVALWALFTVSSEKVQNRSLTFIYL